MHPSSHDPSNPHGPPPPGYGQAPQHGHQGYGQPPSHPHGHAHAHAHDHGGPGMIACPQCGQPSDSIKAYTMMSMLLFLWVFASWRTKRVVACAPCMRKELLVSTAINTVAANLISPIVWLWHGVLFGMTFGQGHSEEVQRLIR